jgi:hypothetical protein
MAKVRRAHQVLKIIVRFVERVWSLSSNNFSILNFSCTFDHRVSSIDEIQLLVLNWMQQNLKIERI